jgi:cytochrome c-type biogenesis protein CcmH
MLIFWFIAALLVALTLLTLLWPLLRAQPLATAPDAEAAAVAVYRDQKQVLDAECADGVITPADRDQAVGELARRLGDELAVPGTTTTGGLGRRRAGIVALALLLLIPAAAFVLYARLGNPDATAVATAKDGRGGHDLSDSQIAAMVDNLAQRLKSHPDEAEGWMLLARSYAALGRFADAADAYARADALIPDNAALLADYADTLAMAQGKRLAGKPAALVRRALEIDPQQRKALALAATAALEARDLAGALLYWRRLRAQFADGSDDARQLDAIIAEIESSRGPARPGTNSVTPARSEELAAAPAPAGTSITGRVEITPALATKVALTDTVFIFARAVDGPRMPLAVLRIPARQLPADFRLDDSMSMAPGVRLSTAAAVVVEARISKGGNALPQAGDLFGRSATLKPGASNVRISIDQQVP